MRFFLRKKNRLCTEKEIGTLFTEGTAHFIYPIKLLYLTYSSKEADYKLLVTVSKRNFKKAVHRNLIKRRIKEAFRMNSFQILKSLEGKGKGVNIAFIYVSRNILDFKEIEDLINRQLLYLSNTLES